MPEGPRPRAPEGMAGLAKGLAVLEAFDARHTSLTITEAARLTGLARATARRCLLTLVDLGYVTQDGNDFRPTPRLIRLAEAYSATDPLPRLARPQLAAARGILTESVSLAVLEDGLSVFVARAEAERIVAAGVRIGARLPAGSTATGRILLAALDDAEIDAYLTSFEPVARTPKTLVDRAEIRAAIAAARTDDVSFTDEELELGMRSMAVPVRDSRGAVRAALSVSVFTARISLAGMRREFLPVLREHADAIGKML